MPIGQVHASLLQSLARASHAGEVAVSEVELDSLVPFAREALSPLQANRDHLGLLLIFAVNCAYYDFDDQFWSHFFRRLGWQNEVGLQDQCGQRIDLALERWIRRSRHTRTGPWRYVGAVLEEVGITQQNLHRFAEFIGGGSASWWEMAASSRHEFEWLVNAGHVGEFLGAFLRDAAGHQFTRDVTRLLLAWHDRRLTEADLDSAVGFRPGFFRQLLEELGRPVVPSRPALASVSRARIMFNEAVELPGVVFDADAVRRGRVRMRDEPIWMPFVPFVRASDFQDTIDYEVGQDSRSLRFWKPSADRPFALFHRDRGFVPHGDEVMPGQYFLVAEGNRSLPRTVASHTDFNFLAVEGGDFRYWVIEVTGGVELEIPGYLRVGVDSEMPEIEWASRANQLEGAVGVESVFVQSLPGLIVSKAELFGDRRGWALFVDVGGHQERIRDVHQSTKVVAIERATPPFTGRVWIERVGRSVSNSQEKSLAELRFMVLPKLCWDWPMGLHGPDDQPEFGLSCEAGVTAKFEECAVLGALRWRVAPRMSLVQGIVAISDFEVPVARRIFRADCRDVCNPSRQTFDLDEFRSASRIRVQGFPLSETRAAVWSGESRRTEILRAQPFDSSGQWEGSGMAFADGLSAWAEPAGIIEVFHAGNWVHTSTRLFRASALAAFFLEPELRLEPAWFEVLSEKERQFVQTVRSAVGGMESFDEGEGDTDFPNICRQTVEGIHFLAATFNRARTPGMAQPWPDRPSELQSSWKEIADWVKDAAEVQRQSGLDDVVGDLIARYDRLRVDELPGVQTWHQWLRDARAGLEHLSSFDELLAQWSEEIRRAGDAPFRSSLAGLSGGAHLSWAYKTHLSARSCEAEITPLDRAQRALADGEASLVKPLAMILTALIYLRLKQPAEQWMSAPERCHARLLPVFAALSRATGVIAKLADPDEIPALPIPDEDRRRLTAP